jgi:Icc protein
MSSFQKALEVLHITDCHLTKDRGGDLLGMNTYDSLMAVLEHAASQTKSPDYILVTGDIAQDGSVEAYQALKDALSGYSCPISWFPGNHDNRSAMAQVATTELVKVQEFGDWRFVLLDSLCEGKVYGTLSDGELSHLESSLSEANQNTLVCLHHHPVAIDCEWLDRIGLTNNDEFLDIIDRHDHVQGVLWGHIHQDFFQRRNNKDFLATPSTCIQFKPLSKDFALDEIAPGYRWMTLHEDGKIETEVFRATQFEYTLDMSSNGY